MFQEHQEFQGRRSLARSPVVVVTSSTLAKRKASSGLTVWPVWPVSLDGALLISNPFTGWDVSAAPVQF
jgi:hypothetical protein